MSGVRRRKISETEDGMRLDRWFKLHFPTLKHGMLQKLLRKGEIRLDGKKVSAGQRVENGQEVRIPPLSISKTKICQSYVSSKKDIDFVKSLVIYKDDFIIVLNKPSGLAVQGGSKTTRHLDAMLDGLKMNKEERPRLVHRIDRDTSGVIILARSRKVAEYLTNIFKNREVFKLYWALTAGVPEKQEGVINISLEKVGRTGEQIVVPAITNNGGLSAITKYKVLETIGNNISFIELLPKTGRTHQLRAHLKYINCPIIGDRKYGFIDNSIGKHIENKLHLHAKYISFKHPNGKSFSISADLTGHMRNTWDFLGLIDKYI